MSYAREDRLKAQQLSEALEAQGWSVWWDRIIPAGRPFDEVIEEAIESAKCMIAVWSHAGVASDWVREEAEEGKRRGILVPVLVAAEVRIPLGFRRIQAADLGGWDGSHIDSSFQQLIDDIANLLGPPPAQELRRQQAEARRKAEEEEKQRKALAEAKRKEEEKEDLQRAEAKRREVGAEAVREAEKYAKRVRESQAEPVEGWVAILRGFVYAGLLALSLWELLTMTVG